MTFAAAIAATLGNCMFIPMQFCSTAIEKKVSEQQTVKSEGINLCTSANVCQRADKENEKTTEAEGWFKLDQM